MSGAMVCLLAGATLLQGSSRLVEGNPDSKVRVVIYEDLQCSDCADFRKMMDEHLLPKYAKTVAFEHHEFPLPRHLWARPAAIAAHYLAAVKPELAVAFRQHVMAKQAEITPENFSGVLAAFAKSHGADAAKAVAALNDPQLAAAVDEDLADGVARGINRTPTVLVNGRPFFEQFPVEQIEKGIDEALRAVQP